MDVRQLPEPTVVIATLKILTTPSSELSDVMTGFDSDQMFDKMLAANAKLLDKKLCENPVFHVMAEWWKTDHSVKIPTDQYGRWMFVLYCLKSLDCLQKSLKKSSEEFKSMEHEPVSASRAPKMSTDTLSITDQKVVKTTIQFVVCLGICPNLDKGIGIPLETRSEFSKLIGLSKGMDAVSQMESRVRLFLCVKVLAACVFTSSLGTLVLMQHVTDILAGLMQLIRVGKFTQIESNCKTKVGKSSDSAGEDQHDIDESKADIMKEKGVFNSNMSPAEVVDIVKANFDRTGMERKELLKADSNTTDCSASKNTERSTEANTRQDNLDQGSVERNVTEWTSSVKNKSSENAESLREALSNESSEPNQSKVCDSVAVSYPELVESHEEIDDGEVDVEFCEKVLGDLLRLVYPPLLVKTLLLLQGAPKSKKLGPISIPPTPDWMRQACRHQLTTLVMGPRGVQSVLRGMLDRPGAATGMTEAADWRKCDAVARVIAGCPLKSVSIQEYYQAIAPQVIDLLHIPDQKAQREFLRVACSTICCMYTRQADLTQGLILQPLAVPLLSCLENKDLSAGSNLMVEERDLTRCVEDLHKVYVCGSAGNIGMVIALRPVVLTLYRLFVFTRSGVSALRSLCQELIVTFLKHTDLAMTLKCLQMMAFNQWTDEREAEFPRMHPDLCFAHGTNGGVKVTFKSSDSGSEPDGNSDDSASLVVILKGVEDTGAAGEFLVHMLKELTVFIQSEVEDCIDDCQDQAFSDHAPEQALLDLEQRNQSRLTQFYRKLTLLNTVATVCEELGPECINNAHHTLEFVKATLERGVQVCKVTEDAAFGTFETETLTMAMGLLTATLTGAFELTADDRAFMQDLSPLLLEIGSNHPESSVQEMATDIRIAIATHGAIWSELSKSTGKDFAKLSKKMRSQQAKVEKDGKSKQLKPKIEVLSSTSNKSKPSADGEPNAAATGTKHKNKEMDKSELLNDVLENVEEIKPAVTKLANGSPNDSEQIPTTNDGHAIATEKDLVKVLNKLHKEKKKAEDDANKSSETESVNCMKVRAETECSAANDSEMEEIDLAFRELCDPLVPVRGHGLIRLTRLVRNRSPAVMERREAICKIFEENLDHADSYMYLSSVNGLAAMCDVFPQFMVPRICKQFADVVGAVLEGTGVGADRDSGPETEARKVRSTELRMKLGEIMVKSSKSLGETIPQFRDQLISSVLMGARDREPFIRASSLSNLGEICKLLHFSLGNVIHEVFNCCGSLLRSDPDVQVRKAAGQCLTLLLQGTGTDSFKVLDSVLRDLYRLLKQCSQLEKDEGVLLHVQLALTEIDDLMRGQLFPQQKLEKRIRVLDPE